MDSFKQPHFAMEKRGWKYVAFLFSLLPGYTLYCLGHLLFLPFLLVRGAKRAHRISRGMIFPRLLGGGQPPRRPNPERPWTLILSSSLGETRTAVLAAQTILCEHKANIALLVARTESYQYLRKQSLPFADDTLPFNNPFSALLTLLRWRPDTLFFVEMTENYHLCFWCAVLGVKTVVLNVHIQQAEVEKRRKSPWKLWRVWCVGAFAVQGEIHRQRLLLLGVPDARIFVTGPCFTVPFLDARQKAERAAKWSDLLGVVPGETPMILAGSTYYEEELYLLDAFAALQQDFPEALLILAPRAIHRQQSVETTFSRRNLAFDRRSELTENSRKASIILLDTVGELYEVYSLATVAFIGGSLVADIGAHTPLEALAWGVPSTIGPNYDQQTVLVDILREAGVTHVCTNADELQQVWRRYLEQEALCENAFYTSQQLMERYNGVYAPLYEAVTRPQGGLPKAHTVS